MTLVKKVSLKSMGTNRVTQEWSCNRFWSDSILFYECYVTSLIAAVDSDAWWKWALNALHVDKHEISWVFCNFECDLSRMVRTC